jgi:hypothetical protein
MNNQMNKGIEWFGTGLEFFYVAIMVPLISLFLLQMIKTLKQANHSRFFSYLVFISATVLALGLTFFGIYLFIFTFYGFAP